MRQRSLHSAHAALLAVGILSNSRSAHSIRAQLIGGSLATVLWLSAAVASAQLTDGLVAYYSFEDGTAADTSEFGNHATGGEGTMVSLTGGAVGAGFASATGTGFFSAPLSPQNNISGSHAVQIWMKSVSTTRSYLVGQSSGAPNHFPYHVEFFGQGDGQVRVLNDGFTDHTAAPAVNDGEWRHIITTWDDDADVKNMWIDGVHVLIDQARGTGGQASGTIADDAAVALTEGTPLRFAGTDQFGGTRTYTGDVDEVALWNRLLSESEIAELYNGGAGLLLVPGLPGDVNDDEIVDINDFIIIRDNFQQPGVREEGDVTGNGFVNLDDFRRWKTANYAPIEGGAAAGLGGVAVPEPGSVVLALLAVAGLLMRRAPLGR